MFSQLHNYKNLLVSMINNYQKKFNQNKLFWNFYNILGSRMKYELKKNH